MYRILIAHLFLGVMMATHYESSAQASLPNVIPPPPQSQEFQKYGDYPVGNFTGVPDISIPLHEVTFRGYKIPISLRYHGAGIKAYNYPDIFGLGWSLFYGGEISRTVYSTPDEYNDFKKGITVPINDPNPFTRLHSLTEGDPTSGDISYDEFNVTLPTGKSFKFYVGNENDEYVVYTNPMPLQVKITFSRTVYDIDYFDIIDEEGVKYRFSAYERFLGNGVDYRAAWRLTMIHLPRSAEEIIFKYKQSGTYNFSKKNYTRVIRDSIAKFGDVDLACNVLPDGPLDSWQVYSSGEFSGYYYTTLVPDSIIFGRQSIKFNYESIPSAPTELKLSSVALNDVKKEIRFHMNWFNEFERIVRLDSITIKSFTDVSTYLRYKFGYTSSLIPTDPAYDHWGYIQPDISIDAPNPIPNSCTTVSPPQLVTYNTPAFFTEIANPVAPRDTCLFDVWYEYGVPRYSVKIGNTNRDPMTEPPAALNRIDYPTGGYTLFQFECNKYYNTELNQVIGGGGYRIKSISNYTDEKLSGRRTYKYGTNECGYGLVLVQPSAKTYQRTYKNWHSTPLECADPQCAFRERHFNSDNFTNLLGNRLPVIYPEVVEYIGDETSNIGKTIFKYGVYNGSEILQHNAAGDYFIMNDASWQYGQLLEKSIYSNDGVYSLKRKETTEWLVSTKYYLQDKRGYYWFDKMNNSDKLYSCQGRGETVFLSNQHYFNLGKSTPTSSVTIDYAASGDSIVVVNNYIYGDHGFLIEETMDNSDGKMYKNIYHYPLDKANISTEDMLFVNLQAIDTLVARNMVSSRVEELSYSSGNLLTLRRTDYAFSSGNVLPQSIKAKYETTPVEEEVSFDRYDSDGNVQQLRKSDDIPVSFIWGYNNTYPVIKAENCDYQVLEAAVQSALPAGFASLEHLLTASNGVGNLNTSTQRNLWHLFNTSLRAQSALSKAMLSSYIYIPFIGMAGQTDTGNHVTYYEYDSLGRLWLIRDQNGNIIRQLCYNYAGQVEDCDAGL